MPSVNGVPSVTEILRDVGLQESYDFLPPRVRDKAQLRGHALHSAIQWHHEDVLDEASLHPSIATALAGWRYFVEQERLVWRHSELELFHPWNFCGHLDLVMTAPDVGIEIDDLKHTDSVNLDDAALQLAGYGLLWDQNHPEMPHRRRRVIQITRTGLVKPHDVSDQHATQVFTAALMVFLEKRRRS